MFRDEFRIQDHLLCVVLLHDTCRHREKDNYTLGNGQDTSAANSDGEISSNAFRDGGT
jgi:hypothetical protein